MTLFILGLIFGIGIGASLTTYSNQNKYNKRVKYKVKRRISWLESKRRWSGDSQTDFAVQNLKGIEKDIVK